MVLIAGCAGLPRGSSRFDLIHGLTQDFPAATAKNLFMPVIAALTRQAARLTAACALLLLGACGEAPSWQTLLAAKISAQDPAYTVQRAPDGNLLIDRPGRTSVPVDVNAIAAFCLRGTKDCNYATDQMLLQLQR